MLYTLPLHLPTQDTERIYYMTGKRACEPLEVGSSKEGKKQRLEPLSVNELAQHFSRAVHTFVKIDDVIEKGLKAQQLVDTPEKSLSNKQYRDLHMFRELLKIIPTVETFIRNDDVDKIASVVQSKIGKSRSQDADSLKPAIMDLVPLLQGYESTSPPSKKPNRGFNHDSTGSLLCPVDVDWSDASNRQKLKTKEIVVTNKMWPRFVYADHQYDPENPRKGLFRGPLLVMVFKHIFFSPAFACGEALTKRRGHAIKHGMTRVTPGSIAYVVIQTKSALASSGNLSGADSKAFYNNILEVFGDAENYSEEVIDLLAWWDRQIFPDSQDDSAPTSNVLPSTTGNALISEDSASI